MGYDNENAALVNKPYVVFDIETVPMPDCEKYLVEPIEAPANYKDPAKIAQYIADKKFRQVMDAALDIDLCEVAAIGMQRASDDEPTVHTRQLWTEKALLESFWLFALERTLIGFNVLYFDLLVLLRRSLYLGIKAPKVAIDKYRHDGVVDIAEVLSFGRRDLIRSLGFYAKRFDIPHDEKVTGDLVPNLVASGQWPAVVDHCRADVQTTRALAERLGVIQPVREVVVL